MLKGTRDITSFAGVTGYSGNIPAGVGREDPAYRFHLMAPMREGS
jgi:hypothetical protein